MTSRRILILGTLLFAAGSLFLIRTVRYAPQLTHGFAMYYTYARIVLEGGNFTRTYNQQQFDQEMLASGFAEIKEIPNNPPTASVPYLPIAILSPREGKVAWTVLSVILLAIATGTMFRAFNLRATSDSGFFLLILVFIWNPLQENMRHGQVYTLILCLLSLSLLALKRGRVAGSAFPLAVSVLIKGYGLIPLLGLAFRKQWKTAAFTAAGIAGIFTALLVIFPLESWKSFVTESSLGRRPSDANVAYQTLNGFVRHHFTADLRWSPEPLFSLPPGLVFFVSLLCNLAFIAFVLIRSRRQSESIAVAFARLVALSVVTAPVAEEYHYVLYLMLVASMSNRIEHLLRGWNNIRVSDLIFLAGIVLIALPIPYRDWNAVALPYSLLAYPKLIAGITLICVSLPQRNGRAREHPAAH